MLALEDEDAEVSAFFEQKFGNLVDTLLALSVKNRDTITYDPPTPEIEKHAQALMSLIINYEEQLSTERILVKLITAGETLLQAGLPALAVVKCFNRYSALQFSSQMKLNLGTGRPKPNVNLSPDIHPRAQFGKELCHIKLAVHSDPSLRSGATLKAIISGLDAIQATMRDVIKDELETLLYDGTVHTYLVALYLFRTGFAAEAIRPLLWAALSMESLVGLCAPGFLPWRVQLYVLVARCYEEIGKVHAAHSITERAQTAISRTAHLLSLDPSPNPEDADKALAQAELLVGHVAFKYSLLASIHPEDDDIDTTSTDTGAKGKKIPPKETKEAKKPDKAKKGKDAAGGGIGDLDQQLSTFGDDTTRLRVIREALMDPARRALRPTVLDPIRAPLIEALFTHAISIIEPHAKVITEWITNPPQPEEEEEQEGDAAAKAKAEAEAAAAAKEGEDAKKKGKGGKGAKKDDAADNKKKKGTKKGQGEPEEVAIVVTEESFQHALATVPFDLHVDLASLALNYGQTDVFVQIRNVLDLRLPYESPDHDHTVLYKVLSAVHRLRTGETTTPGHVGLAETPTPEVVEPEGGEKVIMLEPPPEPVHPLTTLADVLSDALEHRRGDFAQAHPDFIADAALEVWGHLDGRFEEDNTDLIHPLLSVHRSLIAVSYPDVTLRSVCSLHLSHLLEHCEMYDEAATVLESGIRTICDYRSTLDVADATEVETADNGDGTRRSISTSLVTDASVIYSEIKRREAGSGSREDRKHGSVVELYTAATQMNQNLLYLHGDMESVLCRVQLKIGVREAQLRQVDKLEKKQRKRQLRESQQAIYGMKTNKDLKTELAQTLSQPPPPEMSSEAEHNLLQAAKKNQYRKALLYIHMSDCGRSRPERTALLEQAAAALVAATDMEVRHLQDLQQDLSGRGATKKDSSRAPVAIARSPSHILFPVPSFNVNGKKVHTICYYGKPAGVGTLVSTAHTDLPGTGVPVEPGTRTQISGLEPNETYVFAMTGHDASGERVSPVGSISSEIVALHPLPLLYLWSQLAYSAFHGGCFTVAKNAAEMVCREFITAKPVAPGPEDNPLTAYQVVLDRVADAPLPLLRALVSVIFLLVDIDTLQLKPKKPYDNYTMPKLTSQGNDFAARMLQANRLLLAVQISAAIPHEGLMSQAVSKLYEHILPFLRTKQHQPLLLHVAVQCLSAFKNIPRAKHSESMRRILPCLCHEALSILDNINEPKVMREVLSLVEVTSEIVATGESKQEVDTTEKEEDILEDTEPERALIEVVLDRGFGLDTDATTNVDEKGGKKKDKESKAPTRGKGDKDAGADKTFANPDHLARALLPIVRTDAVQAWQQLETYKDQNNPRYLEFVVRVCHAAITQGVEDEIVSGYIESGLTWADARTAEFRAVFANPADAAAGGEGDGKKDSKGKKADKGAKGGAKDGGDKGAKKKKKGKDDGNEEDEEKARLEEEQREKEEAAAVVLQTKLRECLVQKKAAREFRREVTEHRVWRSQLHALNGLRLSASAATPAPALSRFESPVVVDSQGRVHVDENIPVYPRPVRAPKVERAVEEEPTKGKKGKGGEKDKKAAAGKKAAAAAVEEEEEEEEAVYDPYKTFASQLAVLESYHRAVVLAHRAHRYNVMFAHIVELWNRNTAFFSAQAERLQLAAPTFRLVAWAIMDMLNDLRDGGRLDTSYNDQDGDVSLDWSLLDDASSIPTARASSTGGESYSEPEQVWLSGRTDIDFQWVRGFIRYTLQTLTVSQKWQDVVDLGLAFNELTNGHESLSTLPYVVFATEKLGQDASVHREVWNETARDQTTIFKSLDRARRLLSLYVKGKAATRAGAPPGDTASVTSDMTGEHSVSTADHANGNGPSFSKVASAYLAAVELLRARRERDSLLPALLELGDLYYSSADIPKARQAWNDGIDQAFRANNAAKQWRSLVNLADDLGLWNLYLVACMADRLAQITPSTDQHSILEYHLLAATLIKASFRVSGAHPHRECDFARYTLHELYPGLSLFADAQTCDPTALIDALEHTSTFLIDNGHALEALPVTVLYMHVAGDLLRDIHAYVRATVCKARALVRAGYVSSSAALLRDLFFATTLPQPDNAARIPASELGTDPTTLVFHDHKPPEDPDNEAIISFLAQTEIPSHLAELYDADLCAEISLLRVEWLARLADTEPLLPGPEAEDAATTPATGKSGSKAKPGKDKEAKEGGDKKGKGGGAKGKGKGKKEGGDGGDLDLNDTEGIEYYLTAAQYWLSELRRQHAVGEPEDEDGAAAKTKASKAKDKAAGAKKKKGASEEEAVDDAEPPIPEHYSFHALKITTLCDLGLADIELRRSRLTSAHQMLISLLANYTTEAARAAENGEECSLRDHLDVNFWSQTRLRIVHILARQEQLESWEFECSRLLEDTERHAQHDIHAQVKRYSSELLVEQGSPPDGLALLQSTLAQLRTASSLVPSFADIVAATAELNFQLGHWTEACKLFQEAHDLVVGRFERQGGHIGTPISPLESKYLSTVPTLVRLKVRLLQIKSTFTEEFSEDLSQECATTLQLTGKWTHPHPHVLAALELVRARVARISLVRRYCGLPWGSLSTVAITNKALQRPPCPDEAFDHVVSLLQESLRLAIHASHNYNQISDVVRELIDLYGSNVYPDRIAEHMQYSLHYIRLLRDIEMRRKKFDDLRALCETPLSGNVDVPEFARIEIQETDEHNALRRLGAPEPVEPADGKPTKAASGAGKDGGKKVGGGKGGKDDSDADGITAHKLVSYYLSLIEDSKYAPFSDMVIHTQVLKLHAALLDYPPYAELCTTRDTFALPALPLSAAPAWQVQTTWGVASDDTLRLTYVLSPGDPSEPTPDELLDQAAAAAAVEAAEEEAAAAESGGKKKAAKGSAKKPSATPAKKGGKKDTKGTKGKGEVEEDQPDVPDALSTQAGRISLSEAGVLRVHHAIEAANNEYQSLCNIIRGDQVGGDDDGDGDDDGEEAKSAPRIPPSALNTLPALASALCSLFFPKLNPEDVPERTTAILDVLHPTSLPVLLDVFGGSGSQVTRNRYTCTLLIRLLAGE